jgi:hypothetical protein
MEDTDAALLQGLKHWAQGQQQEAIAAIRPVADEGDESALLLICFFLQQTGQPQEAIPYVKKVAGLGNQLLTSTFFGLLADNPENRSSAVEMVRSNPMGGFVSNDPLGRAVEFANQGDDAQALDMLRAAAGPHPWPSSEEVSRARSRLHELSGALGSVGEARTDALVGIEKASSEVDEIFQGFQTRRSTLTKLLDNLTNASSQSYFDQQAAKYGSESTWLWSIGVAVLAVASLAAFLPLVLNYASKSHQLHGQSNVSAHLGAALALAAVAGVLLARARSRDRDRQRNQDLSVALGTMFAYSEQIANEEEKERFKHDMGRLVLETFLRQRPPTEEASRGLLGEIAASAAPKPNPDVV